MRTQQKSGILTAILLAINGCGTTQNGPEKGFAGLESSKSPSQAVIFSQASDKTKAIGGSVKITGYPLAPDDLLSGILLEGKAGASYEKFDFDPSYGQLTFDASGAVFYDFDKRDPQQNATYDDDVIAFGIKGGMNKIKLDEVFVKDATQPYLGPITRFMSGPLQIQAEYLHTLGGEISAKEGFSGELNGGVANTLLSYDSGTALPFDGRLVPIASASYGDIEQKIEGRINNVKLSETDTTKTLSGTIHLLAVFNNFYAGPSLSMINQNTERKASFGELLDTKVTRIRTTKTSPDYGIGRTVFYITKTMPVMCPVFRWWHPTPINYR